MTVTGEQDLYGDFQLNHVYTDSRQGRDGQRHGYGNRHQLRQRLQRKRCQRDAGCADGNGGQRFDVRHLDGHGMQQHSDGHRKHDLYSYFQPKHISH